MRMRGPVMVDDVLQALVGRGPRIESSTGPQLERARVNAMRDEEGRRVGGEWSVRPPMQKRGGKHCRPGRTPEEDIGGVSPPKLSHTVDPWGSMDRAEQDTVRELGVIRCLCDLAQVKNISVRWISSIVSFHNKALHRAQGELVVLVLRAYHEWSSQSQERALAEVYVFSQREAKHEGDYDGAKIAQEFREGKNVSARRQAAKQIGRAHV